MKKSLLLTLEFPPQSGGVATYYFNVCNNLPPEKIMVLAPAHSDTEILDQKQAFPILRDKQLAKLLKPGGLANKLRQVILLNKIKKIIKKEQIELIQVGNLLPLGTLAYLISRKKKIPYIVYTHGLDVLLPRQFMRKKILIKKILQGAAAIVTNSNFTLNKIAEIGIDKGKIQVIYPCPNFSKPDISKEKIDQAKSALNLQNKKIILSVGRLVPRKGFDLVIKSMADVIKKMPDVSYLIAGTGPDQKRLEDLIAETGLKNSIKLLGHVADKDLPVFYQLCDIFVMPARQIGSYDVEGFGIVYLEANLLGKPVIAGESGGVPEAVVHNQTGILINPGSQKELTAALLNLLVNQEMATRLGEQGRARVLKNFNWKIQTEKIKKLLD